MAAVCLDICAIGRDQSERERERAHSRLAQFILQIPPSPPPLAFGVPSAPLLMPHHTPPTICRKVICPRPD
ncbi:hypothetical protein LZ30DRAFT_707659 [Colletotrichum cereale]|nr:hypothetical protein LZ30DRAFT_707659 [Colletotrichum cereale]